MAIHSQGLRRRQRRGQSWGKDGAHKEEEEESRVTILVLGQKEDGKKARARSSRENAGSVARRGIRQRIAQKEKGKAKETEEKEDGA